MRVLKRLGFVMTALVMILIVLMYKGDLPASEVDAKYANKHSRFLDVASGARIHYRDEGNPLGLPLVLVHGSNASLHTWEPWVQRLGYEFRVITLDLPGHGLTGRVVGDDYSSVAFVAAINAVVEHLGVSGFALGGNSMGGGATWRYTLAYPEKVIAMILIDASGLPQWRSERVQSSDVGNERRPLAFTLLSKPWFRAIARYIDPYQLAAQGVRASYNNSPVVDQALIDRYYELSIREGTRDATLARFSGYSTGKVAAINLSVLRQPTLIMWGAEDGLIPVSVADKFEMALPNARKVVYEDVGHIPMEELPDRSADDVRAFLRTL